MATYFYGGTYISVLYLCGTNFEKFVNPCSRQWTSITKYIVIVYLIFFISLWNITKSTSPIKMKIFIVKSVSAVRPSSATDNLRRRYGTISGYNVLLKLSVTEYGPTAKPFKQLLWNWHIIYPISHTNVIIAHLEITTVV